MKDETTAGANVMSALRAAVGVTVTCWMLGLAGCDLGIDKVAESMDDAVNVLDDAISELGNASSDWQKVLTEAQNKLTEDAQSTIRNEIANVASRSIGQAGVELRCNADFVRERVRQALMRIRAKILKQPVPTVEPAFCQAVPLAVERALVPERIKTVEFYGYDFDQDDGLKVYLEHTGGRQDVTSMLDRPTHYAMTLKFGANGIQLNDKSSRFALVWGGKTISTVAVIQPQRPVCKTQTFNKTPPSITFVPPAKGSGDKEFDGNGPRVKATVTLLARPDGIKARVYMDAKETESDWTHAEGTKDFHLVDAEPGWRIVRIVGETTSSYSYTDTDHEPDTFGPGGPVKRFKFVGDDDGDDAGRRTQVDVTFNRLQIEEKQVGNCVSN